MILMISIYDYHDFEPLFSEFQIMIPKISNFVPQDFKLCGDFLMLVKMLLIIEILK